MKCKVCGLKFTPTKEIMYIGKESEHTGIFTDTVYYDCCDCPRCGRQHILGDRIARLKTEDGEGDDKR